MLYTVHTSYRAFDIEAGRVQNFCQTDRVDCPDKETAKTYCRQRILDENKGGCTIVYHRAPEHPAGSKHNAEGGGKTAHRRR